LQTRETNITELREQAETVQRRRDEKLLGLDQLENWLEQWQRQNNYQQHILRSYADEFSEVSVGPDDNGDDLKLVLNLLEGSLDRLETFMRPDWQVFEVVAADGALVTMDVLRLGPAIVGVDAQHDRGYLLEKDIHGELT